MARRFKAQYNKRPVKDGVYPCDELLPGDGLDPRFDTDGPRKVSNRKALQLCSQVFNSLSLALAECSNDLLRELQLESVVPAPDSSQLLITVSTKASTMETGMMLQGAMGKLRSEIAASINRKRVPQLKFNIKSAIRLD